MKTYVFFLAVFAQAIAGPIENTQLLQVLTAAIEDPKTNPDVLLYFKDALNRILDSIYNERELDVYMTPVLPVKNKEGVTSLDKTAASEVAPNPIVQVNINSHFEGRTLDNPSPVRSPKAQPQETTYMFVIGDLSDIPADERGHQFIPSTKLDESNFVDDADTK